ncbi:hypothetical protein [Aurantiacibacter sp. D1-12]|uniref:hypothetical protein n=1 Tax=Aurantiacibacter sp. D1-12 TaxID=2993658 RepID=UPI00237C6E21|nr:hypothetical protein [Aurantiacibacter sp. D1-12]MDE1466849.1 hypothetical protein [Aurantiacibacter sp. D1-12]
MKKIITSAVAASIMLGSTASAAAPAFDREAAPTIAAEGLDGENGILIALLAAAAIIAGIILIEEGEDEDPLPTSP